MKEVLRINCLWMVLETLIRGTFLEAVEVKSDWKSLILKIRHFLNFEEVGHLDKNL